VTRVTVLAAFGSGPTDPAPVWTDITQWVDIVGSGIAIGRGASDELAQTQTGTCVLALDNQDGRFTPGNASSPYAPNVRRLTPLWVRVTALQGVNYITNPSFDTDLTDWGNGPAPVAGAVPSSTHWHSGGQACRITWDTTGTGGTWQTTVYGLTIGATYTASAWMWVSTTSPAARLVINGSTLGPVTTVTGAWTRTSVSWTATAASATMGVTTGTTSPAAGTQIWIDDTQVEQGAVTTPFNGAAAVVVSRFYGPVASWPKTRKGLLIGAALQASDVFAWMGRQPALAPMLVQEVLLNQPAAYYPLAESSDATSAGDFTGAAQASLSIAQAGAGGTLAFGQGTGPAATGQQAPVFTPASSAAGKYLTAAWTSPVGPVFGGPVLPALSYVFEAWASTTTKGRVIADWATTAGASFTSSTTLVLDASTGQLAIEQHNGAAVTTTTVATANLADGALHHIVVDELAGLAWVDGVSYPAAITGTHDLQVLTVGAQAAGRLWAGTIAHVALYVATSGVPAGATIAANDYAAGTTGWSGEAADIRVQRVAGYAGLGVTTSGTFSVVAGQGQLGSSALTHIREVEMSESGKLLAHRSSPKLWFQSRTIRYNPVIAFSLSFPDTETDQLGEADDDQKMVNIVVASRPGGAVQRVVDAGSLATYGPYQPADLSLLKTTDLQVVDAARWRVARYAQPYSEIRQVEVEAYTMPAATYAALLRADVSTVLSLTDLPADSPTSTATLTVEGYTETIKEKQHKITFHTSRTYTDAVWVLDDPTYSVLGSTTRLAY
jgi:hypothetical protein